MMTVAVVSGLVFMLGIGTWYAIRVGRKLNEADRFDSYKKTARKINEHNRKENKAKAKDSNTNNSVMAPWLRGRK
jgi:hypothetical protein